LTSSPNRHLRALKPLASLVAFTLLTAASAHATLPHWLQHIIGSSTLESALYRVMQLPAVETLYPRPPKESQSELAQLIASAPSTAQLYQLRARADEQSLDEKSAEADWKLYASHATSPDQDPVAAKLELADFYQRRLLIPQAIAVLTEVAAAPPVPAETYTTPLQQRSWLAFDRLLQLEAEQGVPPTQIAATFSAFLTRYPDQPAVYAADLNFQLDQKDFAAAEALILRYRQQFPQDKVFPIRAEALIALRRGNVDASLAVYDRAFQPLWPAELIHSYFSLLQQTHRERAFVADARAQLAAHPDGPEALDALARIFFYNQQAGRLDAAQQTLDAFRIAREARNGAWSAADLYTLTTETHSYAEAARYNYALASLEDNAANTTPTGEPAAQSGLAGLIHILLEASSSAGDTAPPLALGSQNLTLYRDIATLDQGPGYWNGILSLWLNGSDPQSAYADENAKAQSYFHRSKAAELLADLDHRFPSAPERPALHAELIRALNQYGEPAIVIPAAKDFLANFPSAPERLDVADQLADAYARLNDTASEFALYDAQLAELSAKTNGLPLTAAAGTDAPIDRYTLFVIPDKSLNDPTQTDSDADGDQPTSKPNLQPLAAGPTRRTLPEATAYTRILDRYLGRLTATGNLPRALTVLRAQLDRNPNDPLLYERLATFLQQNDLSAQQEAVFQQAIAKFQQPTWYDKLARVYLREKKREAFATLTRQVTDIFSGTDLDRFFANVNAAQPIGPQLAVQLNLYAAKRFPHDLVFTQNLLAAYQSKPTLDAAAYESLLRRTWWESPGLQTQFLTFLARTGKLDAELAALNSQSGLGTDRAPASATVPPSLRVGGATANSNPAALREQAEIQIFTSHFEQAAPLLAQVATLYPADEDTGDQAVSLFRSLSYSDPTTESLRQAVAFETNLLTAAPDNADRLATLGDLYAEATATGGEDLTAASPYWRRIPALHPGSTQGFLTAATIFWDYFQFDDALAQLTAARQRFNAPALFGYEAGAIDENRHDLPAAVAEYTAAVLNPPNPQLFNDSGRAVLAAWFSPPSDAADSKLWSTAQSFVGNSEAYRRLMQLATRASTKALVDTASASAVAAHPTSTTALTLRADILAAQVHAPALTPLLTTLYTHALDHAATEDEAAAIGTLAQARNLTPVYERALAKQAALTLDPVQKIQLQYTLVHSLEAHNDNPAATRITDAVYTANPRLLGVVRATTDFYVRNKEPQRAIATLLEAAKAATPSLSRDFTLEAANDANEAGDTTQARTLATGLLAQTPYDAQVLNLIATSYARAHDDAGLKQWVLTELAQAKADPNLTPDARQQNIALLRRSLIPALTRQQDYAGAIDQYIALLSAFPEDSATAQEAALYALKHGRQTQLLDFLRTTVKQSPRDSRFMILLAQVETTFEDLPAAESAYTLAIAIRHDRADLYTARADLEIRLSQTDPAQSELAAADFQRLYLLTYHDPAWMIRLAQLRARQQRPADAVKALQTAYIEGHAPAAADSFTVADQLSQWNLLTEARTFAEQGVHLAGSNLLTARQDDTYPPKPSGAVIYARILTRLGHADAALAQLTAARKDAEVAATSPSVISAEIARENISGDEARQFRENYATQQRQLADQTLNAAVRAIGAAVKTFYTPEQKLAYAQTLDQLHATNAALALTAATSAGLADREADWRKQALLTQTSDPNSPETAAQRYIALQQSRLQFTQLAQTLEAYAARLSAGHRQAVLEQAARAYRDAGDIPNETRFDHQLVLANDHNLRDRFFDLLLAHDREALTALAASKDISLADAALNYAVVHANQAQALAAVARRGQNLPPVWRPASASLVETYFANPSTTPATLADFTQPLLTDETIAEHLATKPDPLKQITGDNFFYYASRFGILLSTVPKSPSFPDPEDFLPAELEAAPTSPTPYLNLARTYAEADNLPAALNEYNHALELTPAIPNSPAIDDEIAVTLFRAGRKDDAIAHWRTALDTLRRMQQHAIYPEAWFTSLETITRHLGERRLTAAFRPDLETILGPYLAKNGTYRSNELLKSVYQASATPAEGTDLILTLAAASSMPEAILNDLDHADWLATKSSEALLARELVLAEKAASSNDPDANSYTLNAVRSSLLNDFLSNHEDAKAQAILDAIPEKEQSKPEFAEDRLILAAHAGRLNALLDTFSANPETAPTPDTLTAAANQLATQEPADKPNARVLLEFVFDQKQLNHSLQPTDFLTLAQSRIDTDDLPGAISLLQRLTLQPPPPTPQYFQAAAAPDPYANTDSAASLLEKAHHPAEAIPFLQSLVQSVPWNASFRLRLAEAQLAANAAAGGHAQAQQNLLAVAKDASAPYALRAKAARELQPISPSTPQDLGSRELTFLAHPTTPADARQPYFAAARIAAAALPAIAPADRQTLLREAIAIAPNTSETNKARLTLLLLQPAEANPSGTLAILNSIQAAPTPQPNPYVTDAESDTNAESDDVADTQASASEEDSTPTRPDHTLAPNVLNLPAITLPAAANSLDLPTRIRLASQLSTVTQRNSDLTSAYRYAQLALSLSQDLAHDTPEPTLTHRLADLTTAILLERRNALRRPNLTAALAQSVQVRPRLTPSDLAREDLQ
jgi:hypothetical protein